MSVRHDIPRRPGLMAWHVSSFFGANPDEELTVQMMVGKWGGTIHAAQACARSMERAGHVVCQLERTGRGTPPALVIRAGPELLRTIGVLR